MALPIGTISSPDPAVGWLQGTVFAPSWGNLVQGNINGLIAGTGPTLKALQIDGVGGNSSATAAGNLAISGTASAASFSASNTVVATNSVSGSTLVPTGVAGGTTLPTPAFTKGSLYKESAVLAIASIASDGTLVWGVNIASTSLGGTGGTRMYTINLNTAAGSTSSMVPIATSHVDAVIVSTAIASTSSVTIRSLFNPSTPQDAAFFIVIFGS